MASLVFVDTNLLLLLCAGLADPSAIARHKRLQSFDVQDYDLLQSCLSGVDIAITPNVATETSNLLRQTREPDRSRIAYAFRTLAQVCEERYIATRNASNRTEYVRLGITDSALLECVPDGAQLLTEDVDLYLAAAMAGIRVLNFNHIRETRDDFRV